MHSLLRLLLPATLLACGGAAPETDTSDEADADTDTDTDADTDSDTDTDTDTDADSDTDTNTGPALVYAEDFEGPALEAGGFTSAYAGEVIDGWDVFSQRDEYYDPNYGTLVYFTDGGLLRPTGTEFLSVDPLAAPASGSQTAYITNFAALANSITGQLTGYTGLTVEAATAYTLTLAVGRRQYYGVGDVTVYLYAGTEGDVQYAQATLAVGTIPEEGWSEVAVAFDPPDTYAGTAMNVQIRLASTTEGYATAAFDNVQITATPGAAN